MCLAEYQQKFRYMLVDEYQDTNVAQYLWLRLLAQGPGERAPTSAASATTTSRSMAGAARRSTTSCASRRISPAPSDPAGAQLPLHPEHILGAAST
jgi:superfamily I DNA/RNA helicase